MGCSYLMPIRRSRFDFVEAEGLRSYFQNVRTAVGEIIVIDGSPPAVFKRHHQVWSVISRHEPVDRRFGFINDKVNGIQTGVRLAANDKIILGDDDVRYTRENIEQIVKLLDNFELGRPQNYFGFSREPDNPASHADKSVYATNVVTFTARTEAARMLINRATLRTGDYPGTCAFRRDMFLRASDYDGDVLFDNEELIRHFAGLGRRIAYANDLFIEKRPPTFRKWVEQRPRQAYEDFGLRAKTLLFAAIPIGLIAARLLFGIEAMLWCLLGVFVVAFITAFLGWSRGEARKFFPLHICLFAPLWLIERSLSTYWAFYWYIRWGGYPFGDRLLSKGIGRDWVKGGKIAARQ